MKKAKEKTKTEKKRRKRKKILRNVKDDKTFMTGAGLQIDSESDDEKLVLNSIENEDSTLDEIMKEIKRDVLKIKNVRGF